MNIIQMRYCKDLMGYSYERLSELSGVPKETIEKIFSGDIPNPQNDVLQALEGVLHPTGASMMAESQAVYSTRENLHTLEDYYALPDDQRVELIDGVFYEMTAPTTVHQIIAFQLGYQIESYVEKKGGNCIPYISPVDVQLDCDELTMVQPDVLILCDREKDVDRCIYGAPDFIAEVLSPSTKKKDISLKNYKYANAGVREYWIIDPALRQVLVYHFENFKEEGGADTIHMYGFHDQIPVQIYGGDLKIDFDRISQKLGRDF